MKKIYILLLLAPHVSSTSCMEEKTLSTDLMEKLYNNAADLIKPFEEEHYPTKQFYIENCPRQLHGQKLFFLVDSMKNAKQQGITEDSVGAFAYNHSKSYWSYTEPYIPLVFSCLKRYSLTANATNESLPFDNDIEKTNPNNRLARTLGMVQGPQQYPAYSSLAENLLTLLKQCYTRIDTLTSYVYEDKKIELYDYPSVSYATLQNRFHNEAQYVLENLLNPIWDRSICVKLSGLIQMIDKAKTMNCIQEEKDLGYAMLEFEPTNWLAETSINIKQRISLFCISVANYNTARGKKITPIGEQYTCYGFINNIKFALPDSNTLFDKDTYAFTEFEQLKTDITDLMKSPDEDVQLGVNHFYPPRK